MKTIALNAEWLDGLRKIPADERISSTVMQAVSI